MVHNLSIHHFHIFQISPIGEYLYFCLLPVWEVKRHVGSRALDHQSKTSYQKMREQPLMTCISIHILPFPFYEIRFYKLYLFYYIYKYFLISKHSHMITVNLIGSSNVFINIQVAKF